MHCQSQIVEDDCEACKLYVMPSWPSIYVGVRFREKGRLYLVLEWNVRDIRRWASGDDSRCCYEASIKWLTAPPARSVRGVGVENSTTCVMVPVFTTSWLLDRENSHPVGCAKHDAERLREQRRQSSAREINLVGWYGHLQIVPNDFDVLLGVRKKHKSKITSIIVAALGLRLSSNHLRGQRQGWSLIANPAKQKPIEPMERNPSMSERIYIFNGHWLQCPWSSSVMRIGNVPMILFENDRWTGHTTSTLLHYYCSNTRKTVFLLSLLLLQLPLPLPPHIKATLLQETLKSRTYGAHKNQNIWIFFLTTLGPFHYDGPP